MEKLVIFDQNYWKNCTSSTFWISCFYRPEGRLFFQNTVKHIFLAFFAKNQKMEKLPILDQKHGLTPLEKSQFFDSFNLLFLCSWKASFLSELSWNTLSCLILPKIKIWKTGNFWLKIWTNHSGKIPVFRFFEFPVFIEQKGVICF